MLNLTMSVSGAPAGDYVLEDKLRDVTGDKATHDPAAVQDREVGVRFGFVGRVDPAKPG